MAIVIAADGAAVLAAEIQSNWDAVRTVINAQTTNTIRRKVFNHYHLPTHIAPRSGGSYNGYDHLVQGNVTVDVPTYPFSSFTDADIRTKWAPVCTLNAGGTGGYQLTSSKVLIWATVLVKNWVSTAVDYKACCAITASINGAAEARLDTVDDGFLLAELAAAGGSTYGAGTLLHHEYEWQPLSLWTLYEHTGSPFTLSSLLLRCAAEGSDYIIQRATLGFVALYRTNA